MDKLFSTPTEPFRFAGNHDLNTILGAASLSLLIQEGKRQFAGSRLVDGNRGRHAADHLLAVGAG